MSICSKHQEYNPDCKLCNTDIRELIPQYDQMVAEAENAGTNVCKKCDFKYYKTVNCCPKCGFQDDKKKGFWQGWKSFLKLNGLK
mgnify:CR=1 FL=1